MKVIGTMGGTVSTPAGASIVIPAGALPGDTMISITAESKLPPSMFGTAVGVNYLFGPSGTLFLKPVTMNLPFGDLPAGVNASKDLQILTAPDNSDQYTSLGPAMLLDAHHAGATTLHFSQCVVATNPPGSVGGTTSSGGTTGGAPGQCQVSCLGGSGGPSGTTTGTGGMVDAGAGGTTTGSGGAKCMTSADCAAGTMCVNGACTAAMDNPDAGPTGGTTGSTGGTTGSTTGSGGAKCMTSADCATGLMCVNGSCGGGTPTGDGGVPAGDGGTTMSGNATCGCQDACNGNSYQLVCNGTTCSCIQNGVTTMMFGQSSVCSDTYTAWLQLCMFPANMSVGTDNPDGGGTVMKDGGSGGPMFDGGTGGTTGTTGSTTGMGGNDGSTGGGTCTPMCGGGTSSCNCNETCNGKDYGLACNGTSCMCNSAGGTPMSFTATGSPCSLSDFKTICGAP
jgi:hypothetical protein